MSTIQTILVFPILFLLIVALLQMGPVLYQEVDEAAVFHLQGVESLLQNQELYALHERVNHTGENRKWVSTSADRMHFLVHSVVDSFSLIWNEVTEDEE